MPQVNPTVGDDDEKPEEQDYEERAGDREPRDAETGGSGAAGGRELPRDATANWKPPDCYVRVAASKLREERSG